MSVATATLRGSWQLPDGTPRRGTVTVIAEHHTAQRPSPLRGGYVTHDLVAGAVEIVLELDDPAGTYAAVVRLDRGREVIGPVTGISLTPDQVVDLNTLVQGTPAAYLRPDPDNPGYYLIGA